MYGSLLRVQNAERSPSIFSHLFFPDTGLLFRPDENLHLSFPAVRPGIVRNPFYCRFFIFRFLIFRVQSVSAGGFTSAARFPSQRPGGHTHHGHAPNLPPVGHRLGVCPKAVEVQVPAVVRLFHAVHNRPPGHGHLPDILV